MPDILQIREEIIAMLGIENLSEAMREHALATAGGPIIQSVTLAILERLPKEEQEAFKEAFKRDDSAAVQRIIETHIPDADTFIPEEIRKAAAQFKQIFEGLA